MPVPVSMLVQYAQYVASGAHAARPAIGPMAATAPAPPLPQAQQPQGAPGPEGQLRKHRTIIGELKLDQLGPAGSTISIGRTPDNQIVVSHAQVSSKHAQIVKQGSDPARLSSAGFGMERPIDTNDTAAGRQNNRRVEFHIDDAPSK